MRFLRQPYKPGHAGYVSPFTEFIDGFLQEHPEVVEDQRKGWYLYWDHHVDLDEQKKASEDSVPVKGYDYF